MPAIGQRGWRLPVLKNAVAEQGDHLPIDAVGYANMPEKDKSLAPYPEFAEYGRKSMMFVASTNPSEKTP